MKTIKKKKEIKQVPQGKIFIQASFNNTIVTVSDLNGNVLSWASAGSLGFKGAKKATPFAAGQVTKAALEKAAAHNLSAAIVEVSGVGTGRDQAVRALIGAKIRIVKIKDTTPIPHNGCRPKKLRRV